jgi:hypothetical protein
MSDSYLTSSAQPKTLFLLVLSPLRYMTQNLSLWKIYLRRWVIPSRVSHHARFMENIVLSSPRWHWKTASRCYPSPPVWAECLCPRTRPWRSSWATNHCGSNPRIPGTSVFPSWRARVLIIFSLGCSALRSASGETTRNKRLDASERCPLHLHRDSWSFWARSCVPINAVCL